MVSKIDALIAMMEKEYGKGVVVKGSDLEKQKIVRISTGIFILDYLLLGGLPAGKVSLLRGKEGSGKTLLALLAMRNYQDMCSECLTEKCEHKKPKQAEMVFMDAEGKFPLRFKKALGIDDTRFSMVRPETSEQAIDLIEKFLRNENVGFFVLDSIAALVPAIEIEKSAEEWQQGLVAREINKLMRKITGALQSRAKKGRAPTIILINQDRFKIGVIYGDPTTISGGEGQKYISSVIIKSRPIRLKEEKLEGGKMPTKIRVGFTIMKHSYGPAYTDGEYTLKLHDANGPCVRQESWIEQMLAFADVRGLIERKDGMIRPACLNGSKYSSLDALTSDLEGKPDKAAAMRRMVIEAQAKL